MKPCPQAPARYSHCQLTPCPPSRVGLLSQMTDLKRIEPESPESRTWIAGATLTRKRDDDCLSFRGGHKVERELMPGARLRAQRWRLGQGCVLRIRSIAYRNDWRGGGNEIFREHGKAETIKCLWLHQHQLSE